MAADTGTLRAPRGGGEPEKELKALAPALERAIAAGRDALEERRAAAATRADQRVREVLRLVDDVNAVRLSLYGKLIGFVEGSELPRDWPEQFFRRSARQPKARRPTAPASTAPTPAAPPA